MPIIKRYPNRKLYDTEAKRYITLDGIAALIRDGREIQVIDHANDEDLTAVTLTQIIFEQEKRQGGFLPKSVLTSLVRAGGDTLNSLKSTLTSPLELLKQVDSEIESRIESLVERGEMALEEAAELRDQLLSRPDKGEQKGGGLPGQQHLERLLSKRGVPSKEDVAQLSNQIEQLTHKIDSLIEDTEPADNS
jgi:polyhydroxyalkanoate synthesis repressor PhaR